MNKRTKCVPGSVTAVLALGALAAGLGPVFADAATNDQVIIQHRARQEELMNSANAILARAETEARDLAEAELTEVEGLNREHEQIERQIALRERTLTNIGTLSTPRPRQVEADDNEPGVDSAPRMTNTAAPGAPRRAEPQPRATARGNWGFRNFGEFAMGVRNAKINPQNVDGRLTNAALSTYGNEGSGSDGGFAVPPDFRADIMARVFGQDSLASLCDRIPISGNSFTAPTDMTTPWDATGGIQAYWTGEAETITQSKPKLQEVNVKAHKLNVLVPITEEALEDSVALDGYLRRKAPEKIDFKLSFALAWGTGAGMPLGFMNSPALVTVAAEGAQTADTINAANVVKMLARLPVNSRRNAVWLIHPDAEAQLPLMTIGQTPAYVQPGGFQNDPFGRLLGRPVVPHQVCETVGDLGDIMLVDMTQYLLIQKTGGGRDTNGIKFDTSMHLWFDQDTMAFKFGLRAGGQPWWSSSITQRDGSNAQSPFVTLASR